MKNKKYEITFLGKTLHTDHYYPLTKKDCQKLRNEYRKKPLLKQVEENFKDLHQKKNNLSYIIDYYLKDLIDKVKLHSAKWSIEEVLQCDDLIRYFYSRFKSNTKVYPEHFPDVKNFKTALRISGGSVTMKASNFPINTVDEIIEKYNINNNFYDFSCGWGIRMLSSIRNKVNYYGTDPNHLLIEKLKKIHKKYDKINNTNSFIDIRCMGSEEFIPEWEGKMGLIFSSPPYYILEDYKIGNQSIKNNKNYDDWLNSYLYNTMKNCNNYLIDGGYILVNIKNILNYKLYDDTKNILSRLNLKYVGYKTLKNIKRPSTNKNINTDEKIMIFKKLSSKN
jgi:hypothetical protein